MNAFSYDGTRELWDINTPQMMSFKPLVTQPEEELYQHRPFGLNPGEADPPETKNMRTVRVLKDRRKARQVRETGKWTA